MLEEIPGDSPLFLLTLAKAAVCHIVSLSAFFSLFGHLFYIHELPRVLKMRTGFLCVSCPMPGWKEDDS